MRIAVVTPFYKTPKPWLQDCIDSVQAQTIPCTHILVSDGDPEPDVPQGETIQLLRAPQPHRDGGSAGRALGSVTAIMQGFDAIAYLDADNWFQPNHLATLVACHERTQAPIITCSRTLHHLDGSLLGLCTIDDGISFVDTSCYLVTRPAFGITAVWYLMDQKYGAVCDRVFWENIQEWKIPCAHTGLPTVAFRTNYESDYLYFEVEPPEGAKGNSAWPPPGLPGFPLWSPMLLQTYRWPQTQAPPPEPDFLHNLQLKPISLILLPDWSQPEDALYQELNRLLRVMLQHPARERIKLLVGTSHTTEEDANLILCDLLMNLMLEQAETSDELDLALLGELTELQWQALRPCLCGYIPLLHEDSLTLTRWGLRELPIFTL